MSKSGYYDRHGYRDEDMEDSYNHHVRMRAPVSIIATLFSWLFVVFFIGLVSTGFAQAFGFFHVYEKARQEVAMVRNEKAAWMESATCKGYIGALTEEERTQYSKAHLIPTKYCDEAIAILKESEYSQRLAALFTHYAFCEPGKCWSWARETLFSVGIYVVSLGFPMAVVVLVVLWLMGRTRPVVFQGGYEYEDDSGSRVRILRQRMLIEENQRRLGTVPETPIYNMNISDYEKQKIL